ncbi:four helix bundle protein [Truepera radiovictrix]|uniref:four helix bundle protein n=1 Tax=Truepera radiovictrix TaxID=332249 RepID=UPI0011D0FD5A|nr:four helix bundle protein [Truepera radiovictrix]WMT58455.1 four helix bundle protein [Truepera radiovictrix]
MPSEGFLRFEDIIAWQKARVLARNVYLVTKTGEFARDVGLARQMQRAAVSVMSNVAEGFERSSPAEFHRYVVIAKASCAELRSQLYLAKDVGYLSQGAFKELMKQAEEVARVLGGLRASIDRRK